MNNNAVHLVPVFYLWFILPVKGKIINCACVCVCEREMKQGRQRESTQAAQRGFPSSYSTRVSGMKPSLSLGFDTTHISVGSDKYRERGFTCYTSIFTSLNILIYTLCFSYMVTQCAVVSDLIWMHHSVTVANSFKFLGLKLKLLNVQYVVALQSAVNPVCGRTDQQCHTQSCTTLDCWIFFFFVVWCLPPIFM